MAVEIEAKMRVDDLAAVRERLRNAGARRTGEVVEENIFFDAPDHALRSAGSGLRLRRNRDVTSGKDHFVLTFKGPRQASELKVREEIETAIRSRDAMIAILARLGYRQELSFEKRRETWELSGCHVELDELPQIGRFVEIEGPDEATVIRVRESLGLGDAQLIKEPYVAMVARQRGHNATSAS
jgi:adenylate cyclase class 2